MGYAEEQNLVRNQKPPIRLRPNGKQRRLLRLVFKEGLSFVDAVSRLHILPQTTARWLRQPLFMRAMFDSMTKFYVNAQIERLRGVSNAVTSLSSADLSDAQRKAHVDLLRLHKVFSLDSPEGFGPLSGHVWPQSDSNGPQSGHFGPQNDSSGPQNEQLGPQNEPSGPPSKQDFPRFSPKNAHSAPFAAQNHENDGPIVDSGPPEPVSPYKNDDPDNPAYAHCDWFRKMFEDWNAAHPDDPDVIAYHKSKKNLSLK